MLQRQVEMRREAARRWPRPDRTISGVQSIGSSELMRNTTSAGISFERAQQLEQDDRGHEIAAVRAEVHAGKRDFLEAGRARRAATSRTTSREPAGSGRRRASSG